MPQVKTDTLPPPRPTRSLAGRVAIVAGAGSRSSGIGNGRAAAILLAESGASVVCADVDPPSAQETVDMITEEFGKGKSVAVRVDVTKADECRRVVELALETFGRLDILVNNVGIAGPPGSAVDVDEDMWRKAMDVNVLGMVLMTKYAVPAMERNEGHEIRGRGAIVNVASVAGVMGGMSPMLLYPTSKGAVVNMTRAMAAHHASKGIRVNCVCPGLLYTPMLYSTGMSQETRSARRQSSLLQTEGTGWDAGLAVRFLASDEARWITGTALTVDAGYTAVPGGARGDTETLARTLIQGKKGMKKEKGGAKL